MLRILAIAVVCSVLSVEAEGAPRRQRTAPAAERAPPTQPVQEQDEFRSCDVAVRDFVQGRKEATALPVKEVKADGLRMTLNFVHPYGESGDTPPNLAFTRGETVEERRKALNEAKQRIRTLEEAARTGNVWYVIALNKEQLDVSDGRRNAGVVSPDEDRASASAVVMASIENKCVTVAQYASLPLASLGDELRGLLSERGQATSPADSSAAAPPS